MDSHLGWGLLAVHTIPCGPGALEGVLKLEKKLRNDISSVTRQQTRSIRSNTMDGRAVHTIEPSVRGRPRGSRTRREQISIMGMYQSTPVLQTSGVKVEVKVEDSLHSHGRQPVMAMAVPAQTASLVASPDFCADDLDVDDMLNECDMLWKLQAQIDEEKRQVLALAAVARSADRQATSQPADTQSAQTTQPVLSSEQTGQPLVSGKRRAARTPSPLDADDEAQQSPAELPPLPDQDVLSALQSFDAIVDGLLENTLSIDDLVADYQKAWTDGVDKQLDELADMPMVRIALEEARSMGEEQVETELEKLLETHEAHALPSMQAYARLWKHDFDGDEDIHRIRVRVVALILAVVSALCTYLKALPPSSRNEWAVLETSMLIIEDANGTKAACVREHVLNMYALQPHDLCLSSISREEWAARRPREGEGAENMDHTLLEGTGKNKNRFFVKQAISTTLVEELLCSALESSEWQSGLAHIKRARHRAWRLAGVDQLIMGLYYVDPTVMQQVVKSRSGSGLHAHYVRSARQAPFASHVLRRARCHFS